MARYRESIFKQSRRAGVVLDIAPNVGAKLKRSTPPGQHGAARKKVSEYGVQLAEKQKVRRTYGLLEKQFRRTYEKAVTKKGVTGTVMLQLLEARLDNVVYRAGLGTTRPQCRQLINHGHFLVIGQKVDIPSYQLKPGDIISVREKSKAQIKHVQEVNPFHSPHPPHWLDVDVAGLSAKLKQLPEREDLDQSINESLIIEYYSR